MVSLIRFLFLYDAAVYRFVIHPETA